MFEPIKELGQNFLLHKETAQKMVEALELSQNEVVVEIGPGLGFITELLASTLLDKRSMIYAVEIDARFTGKLSVEFFHNDNILVVHEDILKWLPGFNPKQEIFKIIGSLPYNITSPILHTIAKLPIRPTISVFLVQKEVAKKINCKAPDSSFLSSFVQTFFSVENLGDVKKDKFSPIPKVDAALIRLRKTTRDISFLDVKRYIGFLHKAYAHPRKMLNKVFTKKEIEKIGINPSLRAQNYNSEDWVNFFKKIR